RWTRSTNGSMLSARKPPGIRLPLAQAENLNPSQRNTDEQWRHSCEPRGQGADIYFGRDPGDIAPACALALSLRKGPACQKRRDPVGSGLREGYTQIAAVPGVRAA